MPYPQQFCAVPQRVGPVYPSLARKRWSLDVLRAQPALECGGLTPPSCNGKKALHDPARGGSRRARPAGQRKANASFYRTVMRFGIERLKVPDDFEVVWSPERG